MAWQHPVPGSFLLASYLSAPYNSFLRQDIDGEKCGLSNEDEAVLKNIAKLLGLESQAERLKEVLLIRQINVRGTITDIPLRLHEVIVVTVLSRRAA